MGAVPRKLKSIISLDFNAPVSSHGTCQQLLGFSICLIIDFRMLLVLLLNISDLLRFDLSSAGWTSFLFGHLVNDLAPELIFLDLSRHKPVSIQALQVISVEALVYPAQVRPVRESQMIIVIFLVLLNVVLKANGASSTECVVVLCEYLPDLFVSIIHQPIVIIVLLSLIC